MIPFTQVTRKVALVNLLAISVLTLQQSRAHPQEPDITAFTFKPSVPTNLNLSGGEDSSTTNNQSSDADESDSEASIVSSSLLYDGGCIVSAEAIMCSGGERSFEDWLKTADPKPESDDDDDDDDDDDENDGHSSMLSNDSLRRKLLSNGPNVGRPKSTLRSFQQPSSSSHRTMASKSPSLHPETGASSNKAVLSIRGGAAGDLGTEFAKRLLVTALVTLVYEAVIGHILEFVKIVMQTSPDGTTYTEVLKKITAQKGIGGLWDGFLPWGVIQAIFKGSVFGLAHAIALSIFLPLAEQGAIPVHFAQTISGGIGGGFQGFVLSPTLLLKTRVMTADVFREKMSVFRTTWLSLTIGYDIIASEGVGALMKGSGIFATKRVADWASRFYFSDLFESFSKAYNRGAPLSVGQQISCSLLGGTFSTIVTLPLDVLVAKIQDAKKAGMRMSAWRLFKEELNEKGWVGLKNSYMNGFGVRLAHVAFTTVAVKTGTPIAYDLLFPTKEVSSQER